MTSPLTRPDDFDRLMADWMEAGSHARAPEALLGTVVGRTRRTRRLSAWLLPERWIPRTFSMRLHAVPRVLPIVLLIVLLVAATLVALTIGSAEAAAPTFRSRGQRTPGLRHEGHDLRLEPGRQRCAATDRRGRPRVQSHLVPGWDPHRVLGRRESGLVVHCRRRWQQRPEPHQSHLDRHQPTADLVT